MVKSLKVNITVSYDTEQHTGDSSIDIKGEYNETLLFAMLAQCELLKEAVMEKVKESVQSDKGPLDGLNSWN